MKPISSVRSIVFTNSVLRSYIGIISVSVFSFEQLHRLVPRNKIIIHCENFDFVFLFIIFKVVFFINVFFLSILCVCLKKYLYVCLCVKILYYEKNVLYFVFNANYFGFL